MATQTSVKQLLDKLGFRDNPFDLREAEREDRKRLSAYFFQHPLFTEFLGDADKPESMILVAKRGAGKTTFRQAIELFCREQLSKAVEGVFDVSYTEFSRPLKQARQNNAPMDIFLHADEILRCAVVRLLEAIDEETIKDFAALNQGDFALLRAYVDRYSELLRPADRGRTFNRLLKERVRESLEEELAVDASLLLAPATDRPFEGDKIIASLPELVQPIARTVLRLQQQPPAQLRDESYILLIRDFIALLKELGYKAMYILIDRLDETSLLAKPENAAAFINPLLTDHDLLDEPGLAFRVFLPKHLEPYVSFRRKRMVVKHIAWSEDDLLELLHRRIRSFSQWNSMEVFCEPSLAQMTAKLHLNDQREVRFVDLQLVRAANNLPRDLILRCRKLFEVYAARNPSGPINEQDLRTAIAADLGDDEPELVSLVENTPSVPAVAESTAPPISPITTSGVAGEIPAKGLYIDKNEHVWRDGEKLETELRPAEFKLLKYLCEHRYQLCPADVVLHEVWGEHYEKDVLRTTLKRLREAVGDDGKKPRYIFTQRGRGLRLEDG